MTDLLSFLTSLSIIALFAMIAAGVLLILSGLKTTRKQMEGLAKKQLEALNSTSTSMDRWRRKEEETVKQLKESFNPYRLSSGNFDLTNSLDSSKHRLVVDGDRTYLDGVEYVRKEEFDDLQKEFDAYVKSAESVSQQEPWTPTSYCPYCQDGAPSPIGMSGARKQRLVWKCDTCNAMWETGPCQSLPDDEFFAKEDLE